MSRRMLVCCSAMPRVSASGAASAYGRAPKRPGSSRPTEPATQRQYATRSSNVWYRRSRVDVVALDSRRRARRRRPAGSGSAARRRPARPAPGRPASRSGSASARPDGVQRRELLGRGQVAVADVVDAAGQRVHRATGRALGPGQQPDAVGEVPRLGAGDRLAGRGRPGRPVAPPGCSSSGHRPACRANMIRPGAGRHRRRRACGAVRARRHRAAQGAHGGPPAGDVARDGQPGPARAARPSTALRRPQQREGRARSRRTRPARRSGGHAPGRSRSSSADAERAQVLLRAGRSGPAGGPRRRPASAPAAEAPCRPGRTARRVRRVARPEHSSTSRPTGSRRQRQ